MRATDGLPVLALIPAATAWKNAKLPYCVTIAEPTSNAAEAYRGLRTAVKFLDIEQPARVIEITSMAAAEGKTTTVANLAVALAQAGDRVVIADCDLRRPRVHEFLGLDNSIGLTSALLGDIELHDAIFSVAQTANLAVLPSGPLPPNPSELLTWSGTGNLVRGLLSHFDYVLIDTPPLLPVTDALVVSSFVDVTLVIATRRLSKRREARRAIEMLRQVDAPIVGTIFNGVSGENIYAPSGYAYYSRRGRTELRPREPESRFRFRGRKRPAEHKS
jgi:capsular exopolysaccharide synthesis family protein